MGWGVTEAEKRQQATHRCRFYFLCHLDTQYKGSAGLGRSLHTSRHHTGHLMRSEHKN
jgi:hypothetical protein